MDKSDADVLQVFWRTRDLRLHKLLLESDLLALRSERARLRDGKHNTLDRLESMTRTVVDRFESECKRAEILFRGENNEQKAPINMPESKKA